MCSPQDDVDAEVDAAVADCIRMSLESTANYLQSRVDVNFPQ